MLDEAATLLLQSRHIYLTGIGSSLHAAMAAAPLFNAEGRPVHLHDAAELLHFATFPPDSSVVALSRTGRSVEIVQLLDKARDGGAVVIGVTNAAEGPLAREAQISLIIPVILDHGISVNTYSTLACAAGALAAATVSSFDTVLASTLSRVLECKPAIPAWQEQIARSDGWRLAALTTFWLGDPVWPVATKQDFFGKKERRLRRLPWARAAFAMVHRRSSNRDYVSESGSMDSACEARIGRWHVT